MKDAVRQWAETLMEEQPHNIKEDDEHEIGLCSCDSRSNMEEKGTIIKDWRRFCPIYGVELYDNEVKSSFCYERMAHSKQDTESKKYVHKHAFKKIERSTVGMGSVAAEDIVSIKVKTK